MINLQSQQINIKFILTIKHRRNLSIEERKNISTFLLEQKRPVLFDRHFYFFSFDSFGVKVDWINMIRDPVERFVSNFHFMRSPGRWRGREDTAKSQQTNFIFNGFDHIESFFFTFF